MSREEAEAATHAPRQLQQPCAILKAPPEEQSIRGCIGTSSEHHECAPEHPQSPYLECPCAAEPCQCPHHAAALPRARKRQLGVRRREEGDEPGVGGTEAEQREAVDELREGR